MSRDGHADSDPGGVEWLRLVDKLCTEFEKAWRTGRPRIEEFLAGWQGEQRLELLRELVALDVLCRRRRGEQCLAADYERFPELSADSLADSLAGQPSAPDQRTSARQERTPLAEDADVPAQVGRYRIEGEVGRGAMGVVLRAHDADFGRPLAIKVLLPRHRGNAELERRFREEARLTGQLQHPGVPAAHEMGTLPDGRPFFALKLVKGRTLADLLAARTAPSEDLPRFLGIFEQLCQAVAYAHSRGVIHRDLKPGNVMVGAFGEVQVMDWGLAKVLGTETAEPSANGEEPSTVYTGRAEGALTQAGTVLGTYAYMPPEQARGEVSRIDERADVFGLGAILCEVLTGSPPYGREQVQRQARQADLAGAFARLDRCGAEPELVGLARACLAAEPAARPRHGGEVAEAVGAYLAGVQQRLRQAELERARAQVKAAEERRRRRVQLALAATLLGLLALAAGGGLLLQRQREQRRREQTAVATALDKVGALHEQERWPEARALLEQALGQLSGSAPAELRQRLQRALADVVLVGELDDIRLQKATLVEGTFDFAGADRAYAQVFHRRGLGPESEEPEAVAARVRGSAVKGQLLAALDDWAHAAGDTPRRAWVLAVARRADPHPWRDRIRDPALWRNPARLKALAAQTKADDLSPHAAVALSWLLDDLGAVQLLRAVQRRHPGDFWVNHRLGRHLDTAGQHEEAIGYLRVAVALRPRASTAHNNLGIALKAKGELGEAIACYRRAIAADPKYAKAHTNLGVALHARGDVEGAIACCREAIALDPKLAGAHYNLGIALHARGDVAGAIACFKRAIAADAKDAKAHYNLGVALAAKGELAGAIACFRRAIAAEPKYAVAHYNLGKALQDKGELGEAIACYRKAIAADRRFAPAYTNLGVALVDKGRVAEAIACYHKAIALEPKNAYAHNNLGRALQRQGKVQPAITSYRQAIAADPRYAPAHFNLGNALRRGGKEEEAIGCFHKAIALDPRYAQAHTALGWALYGKGKVEEAMASYRRAIAADPNYAPAHYNLGVVLYGQGQVTGAIGCFRRAIAANPRLAPAHTCLGVALEAKGQVAAAIACYHKAIALDPENAYAHTNLGVALYGQGQVEEAVACYRRAIAANPRHATAHTNLGNALKRQGKVEEAIACYRRAIAADPRFPGAHGALGEALLQQGLFAEARAATRRSLDLLPPRHPYRNFASGQLQQCQQLLNLDERLAAVRQGKAMPRDAAERLSLAWLCQQRYKQLFATAARLSATAFAERPALADDLGAGWRYNAACAASLAASGQGNDAGPLDGGERSRLRAQALAWLRADLAGCAVLADKTTPEARLEVVRTLTHWRKDPDLAGLRDETALAVLPEPERTAWRTLWADVGDLLNGAGAGKR
jgi:tetratricopeptide (TPR) repeat protein